MIRPKQGRATCHSEHRLCVWQPNNSFNFNDTWSPPYPFLLIETRHSQFTTLLRRLDECWTKKVYYSRRTSFLIPSRGDLNKRNPDWLLEPKIFLRLLYSFPLYKDNKKVEHFSPLLYITYILMRYTYSFIRILNYF